jgi:hypothetical protein
VTALRGVPEVTEAGDIVYTFPELQVYTSYTISMTLVSNYVTREALVSA